MASPRDENLRLISATQEGAHISERIMDARNMVVFYGLLIFVAVAVILYENHNVNVEEFEKIKHQYENHEGSCFLVFNGNKFESEDCKKIRLRDQEESG